MMMGSINLAAFVPKIVQAIVLMWKENAFSQITQNFEYQLRFDSVFYGP